MPDRPNPTEEQTSPRTFEEFMDADRLSAASSGNWVDDMREAWDARQPEIDRLTARVRELEDAIRDDFNPTPREREALDG